jgi:hypothetical protein
MMSVVSLEGGVGLRPRRRRPRGKHRRGLCGRSILHPWCGCGGSEQGPRVAPSEVREVEASFSLDAMRNSSVESSIMAHRGLDIPL